MRKIITTLWLASLLISGCGIGQKVEPTHTPTPGITSTPTTLITITFTPKATGTPTNTFTPTPVPSPIITVPTVVTDPQKLQIGYLISGENIPIPGQSLNVVSNTKLYLSTLDGSEWIEILDEAYGGIASFLEPAVWSPDGQQIAYIALDDYFATLNDSMEAVSQPVYSIFDIPTSTSLRLPSVRPPAWHASGLAVIGTTDSNFGQLPVSLILIDLQTGSVLSELSYGQITPQFTGAEHFCMAPDGETLAIINGGVNAAIILVRAIVQMTPENSLRGSFEILQSIPISNPNNPHSYIHSCAWSPDGTKLAYVSEWGDGRRSMNVFNFTEARLLVDVSMNVWNNIPVWRYEWSPDSQYLAILESDGGTSYITIARVNGSGVETIRPDESYLDSRLFTWTPDGSRLLVMDANGLALYMQDGSRDATINLPDGVSLVWVAFRPNSGFTGPWPEATSTP